jgi:RimJ/RimL family protein N-acetyltransferase
LTAVRLELLSEEHLSAMAELLEDEGVHTYTMVPVPVPPGFERTWYERYEEGRHEGTREAFAIVDGEGDFAGLALAFGIDREGRSVELGYVVTPNARGRGIASAALRLLTEWAFRELDVLRVELGIAADNEASRRVAARAGYVHEGTLRSVHFKQGIRQDMEVWSRLATDPPPDS